MSIPLFTSDYSFSSILTMDKPEPLKHNSPISIVSIAKKFDINPLYLVESTFTGFLKSYSLCKENNIQLIFGVKLIVVNDLKDKSPESLINESKVIVFLNNSAAYYDAIKIFSKAATEGKYYVPRIDWKSLKELWTDNLSLSIPFYDSFLHVNLLTRGNCVPDFPCQPVFFRESHGLPFDPLIDAALVKYCKNNKTPIEQTHSCYYFTDNDIKNYQVYRCILGRTTLIKPNMDHFSSNQFSFQSFCRGKGVKFDRQS